MSLTKSDRETLRRLKEVLRQGTWDEQWEAWKVIDFGSQGRRFGFLLFRFRDWADNGRSMRQYGLPFIWKFWPHVAYVYADLLRIWRVILYAIELLLIVILILYRLF